MAHLQVSKPQMVVRATKLITEKNFMGQSEWVHAQEHDLGTVVHVDADGNRTVRFHRTETATVVFPEEIELVA